MEKSKVLLVINRYCSGVCPYCYQDEKFKIMQGSMTVDVFIQSLDYINKMPGKVIVDILGGEPLLNKKIINLLGYKYTDRKFNLLTNGLEFLRDRGIKLGKNIQVILNITALKHIYDSNSYIELALSIFRDLEYKPKVKFIIDDPEEDRLISKIIDISKSGIPYIELALPREFLSLKEKKESYKNILIEIADYLCTDQKRCTFNIDNICNNIDNIKGSGFCGAGYKKIAIDYDGTIYPCDYFIGIDEFKLGDIYGNNYTTIINEDYISRNLYSECKECPLGDVKLCMQPPCCAHNYRLNNDIFKHTELSCIINELLLGFFRYIYDKYKGDVKDVNLAK